MPHLALVDFTVNIKINSLASYHALVLLRLDPTTALRGDDLRYILKSKEGL